MTADRQLYTPVARLYEKNRPRYPDAIIERAMELGDLAGDSSVLEIGCGPGTATVAFAARGVQMTCIEPSDTMVQRARLACVDLPKVSLVHSALEEWDSGGQQFDAVIAATSIHWLAEQTDRQRVVDYIRPGGRLILLWNLPPEPTAELRELVAQACGQASPFFFGGYSPSEHRQNIRERVLAEFSNSLSDFSFDEIEVAREYLVTDYLDCLATFSQNIRMDPQQRNSWMARIHDLLTEASGEKISTSYCSLLNVALKRSAA